MDLKNKKVLLLIGGIILFIVLGVILVILLTQPKDPDVIDGDNNNNNNTNTVTLEYWGLWEPETVMAPIISEYEANNPGVKIKYTQKPFTQYESTLLTRFEQAKDGTSPAPDIVKINNSWLPKFQKFLSPLPSTVMTAADYKQTFYPTAYADFSSTSGAIYAIPISAEGLGLIYNKTLIKQAGITEPPKDWDTLIEVAQKLTKKNAKGDITQAGLAIGSSRNVKHAADIFSFLLMQNNVEVLTEDPMAVTLTSSKAVSTLEFFKSFTTDYKVWSTDLPMDLQMFYSGTLAMMFAPSWRAFDIIQSAPSVEFDIAPLPQLTGNDEINYAMYWGESVSSTSKNKEAAWKFIKYLSEKDNMKKLYSNESQIRAFGEPYSRPDLAGELSGSRYADAIIKMAPTMKAWKTSQLSYVEEQLKDALYNATERDVAAQDALRKAEEDINEYYKSL